MATFDLVELFVRPLQSAGIDYMISGSLASMYFGEPRLTLDVDLVVHLEQADLPKLPVLFPEDTYYLPPEEVLQVELRRTNRGHFNVIHHDTGMKADCYPSRSHPYWGWAWANRRCEKSEQGEVWYAPPEYVILWKLEFWREGGGDKHLRDIRGMLAVSGDSMDREFMTESTTTLGLTEWWNRAL
jgi:hypothetical protein